MTQNDPSQTKTVQLVDFCFLAGIQEPSNLRDSSNLELKERLTADNVKISRTFLRITKAVALFAHVYFLFL